MIFFNIKTRDREVREKSFQWFSSIDLCTDIKKPGIVFPLKNPKKQLNVATIVDHKSSTGIRLALSEARVSDTKEDIVTYKQLSCIGVCLRINNYERTNLQCAFRTQTDYTKYDYIVRDSLTPVNESIIDSPIFIKFIQQLKARKNYVYPDTDFIFPDNVVKKGLSLDDKVKYLQETAYETILSKEEFMNLSEEEQSSTIDMYFQIFHRSLFEIESSKDKFSNEDLYIKIIEELYEQFKKR